MDNISSQIGALELGDHLESHGDGVLETAGTNAFGPTIEGGTCPPFCRRIDDGALEAAAAKVDLGATERCRPTLDVNYCR